MNGNELECLLWNNNGQNVFKSMIICSEALQDADTLVLVIDIRQAI